MRFAKRSILLICISFSVKAYSQTTRHHGVFWGRLILADRINDRWKWELFLQKRTQNIPGQKSIFGALHYNSFWFWMNYRINKSLKLYLSPIGYFDSYPFLTKPEDVDLLPGVKEFRFSSRLEQELKGKFVNFSNRFTVEYRRRDINQNDVYVPNWRMRYMARLEKPVTGILRNKPVSFFISDEVLVQFGEAVKNNANMFDQNRAAAGFSLEVIKNIKTSFSYLNIHQQRANGKDFDNAHALWAVVTFDNLFSQFRRP